MSGNLGQLFALLVTLSSVCSAETRLPPAASPGERLILAAAQLIEADRPVYGFGCDGTRSNRYDCSGFLQAAAARAKLPGLPRDSRSQYEAVSRGGKVWMGGSAGWRGLKPGDLIFFSGTYRHREASPISHVMIYAGMGQMIGAQTSGIGIFPFTPVPPQGRSPGSGPPRAHAAVYAYVRPSWKKLARKPVPTSYPYARLDRAAAR